MKHLMTGARRLPKPDIHDAVMTLGFSATTCACTERFFSFRHFLTLFPFMTKSQLSVDLTTLAIIHGRWINHKDPHKFKQLGDEYHDGGVMCLEQRVQDVVCSSKPGRVNCESFTAFELLRCARRCLCGKWICAAGSNTFRQTR